LASPHSSTYHRRRRADKLLILSLTSRPYWPRLCLAFLLRRSITQSNRPVSFFIPHVHYGWPASC
jgi:hypothetical protein